MKGRIAIIVLVVTLIVTNCGWAYWLFDAGITLTYTAEGNRQLNRALDETFALLVAADKPGATRADIIAAAVAADPDHQSPTVHDDGTVSIKWLVLTFDTDGHLTRVQTPIRGQID